MASKYQELERTKFPTHSHYMTSRVDKGALLRVVFTQGLRLTKALPVMTLPGLGQEKERMENHILVLKCFYPAVTSIVSTPVLLDKASHTASLTSKELGNTGTGCRWTVVDASLTPLIQKRGTVVRIHRLPSAG